jgi:hypothetical protein
MAYKVNRENLLCQQKLIDYRKVRKGLIFKWKVHICKSKVNWLISTKKLLQFQNRKFVASVIDFPLAYYLFCLILYFTRSWQNLHYAIATACTFGIPLLFFVIPESPRWLIMHNRKEEAVKIYLQVLPFCRSTFCSNTTIYISISVLYAHLPGDLRLAKNNIFLMKVFGSCIKF